MNETAGRTASGERVSAAVGLAERIRSLRKGAGLSQPQLAERLGYTSSYVARVECPERGLPSETVVAAIDQVLGAGGVLVALRRQAKAERDGLREVLAGPRLAVESELSLTVRVRIAAEATDSAALAAAWLQVAGEAIRRAGTLDSRAIPAGMHAAGVIPAQISRELVGTHEIG